MLTQSLPEREPKRVGDDAPKWYFQVGFKESIAGGKNVRRNSRRT